jgi:hypothetical protein
VIKPARALAQAVLVGTFHGHVIHSKRKTHDTKMASSMPTAPRLLKPRRTIMMLQNHYTHPYILS